MPLVSFFLMYAWPLYSDQLEVNTIAHLLLVTSLGWLILNNGYFLR